MCHGVSEGSDFSALVKNGVFDKQTKTPQAKHAETDPCHGTPTMAHFQPPEVIIIIVVRNGSSNNSKHS